MEWNGLNGISKWNGYGMVLNGLYRMNGMEWNGMEWNNGILNGMEWNGM